MCGAYSLRFKRFCVAILAISPLALTSPALAKAPPVTKRGNAQVVVVTPLSLIVVSQLNFGKLISGTTAGTVTLSPTNVRTTTGGVTPLNNATTVAAYAGFGQLNQLVDISLGANSILLTGPGTSMTVNNFVIGSTPTAPLTTTPTRFRIGATSGAFAFPVGATLNVNANQKPGVYTGQYTLTLNYQ